MHTYYGEQMCIRI